MITAVEVRNSQGSLMVLSLLDISNGFVIEEIDGLDPVKATIVSSSFARQDGTQYQAARRENRNIIFKLDYEPDYANTTVRELRQKLYTYFMPKSVVNLRFISDDMPVVEIEGRVEDFSSPLFVAEPKATISILCFDPDFHALTPVNFAGSTTSGTTELQRDYEGSVETGFLFRLMLNRALSQFTIYQRGENNETQSLEFQYPLLNGDILEISTVDGNKGANLIRGGLGSSVLYGISPYASWINLFPGVNNLRIAASGAAIPWTIEYTPKYGGL